MSKQTIIIAMVIMLLISLLAFLPSGKVEANTESAEWMKQLPDDTHLCQMSIPGTHDSGALHSIGDVAGKCQDLSIAEQLAIGVRFLDIRLQLKNDQFVVVHSFVDQALTFEKVLEDIHAFMKAHPSETLIISIKKEADTVNSAKGFADALEKKLTEYKEMFAFDKTLPETLGEMRGKVYVISRYSDASIGVPADNGWQDSTTFELGELYIQDNYCISSTDVKIDDIKKTILYSSSHDDKLTLNFASCYLDNGFPPLYAGTAALDVNHWLKENIQQYNGSLGIVICDFITNDLAKSIYERN